MKKILIALDYDHSAVKVAETGYGLAKSMNAETLLVHVMADTAYYMPLDYSPVMGFSGIPPVDILQPKDVEALKENAKTFLESSKDHLGGHNINTLVAEGEFAETILQTAKEHQIDIIVVGTHSRSALEEIMMGSVTKKLVHDSDIPLFIVPTKIRK